MCEKRTSFKVLAVALLSVLILTAAVLVRNDVAGASESGTKSASQEAVVQERQGVEVQESRGVGETRGGGEGETGRRGQGGGGGFPLSQGRLGTSAPLSLSTTAQMRIVTYAYDDAGRLVQAKYGDKRITYTYDAAGNLLSREIGIEAEVYLPLVLRQH